MCRLADRAARLTLLFIPGDQIPGYLTRKQRPNYNSAVRNVLLSCLLTLAIGAAGCVHTEDAEPAPPVHTPRTTPAGQPVQSTPTWAPAPTLLSFIPMELGSMAQLDVVIKPKRAAEVVLSPAPLGFGGYARGNTVTIFVSPTDSNSVGFGDRHDSGWHIMIGPVAILAVQGTALVFAQPLLV